MDRAQLLQHLEENLSVPQKSERWAMYRLIMPIVDYARLQTGLRDYFEFNQTSAHGTSQSVDIVLLDGSEPRVMIEAKRVDRFLSAEQVQKYLVAGVRGIVTNGVHWVLCADGASRSVCICKADDRRVLSEAVEEVVAFIRGDVASSTAWQTSTAVIHPTLHVDRPKKAERARRQSNPKQIMPTLTDLQGAVENLQEASTLDRDFLRAVIDGLSTSGELPSHLRCEVRASRVSFFDERRSGQSQRVARIELGRQQSDVLVLTEVVERTSALTDLVPAHIHDKGPHMRRFRLSNAPQAMRFGRVLAKLLVD